MKSLTLRQVVEWMGGRLHGDVGQKRIASVVTDSRKIVAGCLFIALKGEKFDGHDFALEALKSGAVAVVAERMKEDVAGWIEVSSTLEAMHKLAENYRKSLSVKVVGVTGSSGKSSVKEMIAAVLKRCYRVHKSEENYNNHIGVPQTLFALEPGHEWAVVEMGMNHVGELIPLVRMSAPDVGVITNIGWAHIENMGSREAIANEKAELIRGLNGEGVAVLCADNDQTPWVMDHVKARYVLTGRGDDATCRFSILECGGDGSRFELVTPKGKTVCEIKSPGLHMVQNACMAAAVGLEVGIELGEIAAGLKDFKPMHGRSEIRRFHEGWLIDDTYNANPDSMLAGIQMLSVLPGEGRSVALLGAMGELGKWSAELHQWIGKQAVESGVKVLFALGEDSKHVVGAAVKAGLGESQAKWFDSHAALASAYQKIRKVDDKILVKGSRSQAMEKVVEFLTRGEMACCTT